MPRPILEAEGDRSWSVAIDGRVVARGEARDVLSDVDALQAAGLVPLPAVAIALELERSGLAVLGCPLTPDELVHSSGVTDWMLFLSRA